QSPPAFIGIRAARRRGSGSLQRVLKSFRSWRWRNRCEGSLGGEPGNRGGAYPQCRGIREARTAGHHARLRLPAPSPSWRVWEITVEGGRGKDCAPGTHGKIKGQTLNYWGECKLGN